MKRIALLITICLVSVVTASATPPRKAVRVGFFEGGEYYTHPILRSAYRDALEHLVGPQCEVWYVPNGFKSAEWKRDQSRALAAEFVRDTTIDIVVAIGPWVIQDLLEAGFKRPIVGLYQFDPASEGLIDKNGRPIARNLTIHVRTDKIRNDLSTLAELYHPRQIGVLSFNSGPEDTSFIPKAWQIGKSLGIEVHWAQGYNSSGTYAFFKAYNSLPKTIEAVYVSPMWGLSLAMIDQFVTDLQSDHVVLFTSEGRNLVEKGVLASGNIRGERSAALFAAWKTVRIIEGETPADLPVEYPETRGYVINAQSAAELGRELSPERLSEADLIKETAPSPEALPLSRGDAVTRALAQNPGYQAIYTAIEAAAQQIDLARTAYKPSVTVGASATRASHSASDNTENSVSPERWSAGVAVDQKLFSLETLKAIAVARQERQQSEASVEQATRDLELAVNVAYMDCLWAQERIAEWSHLRDRVDELRETARLRGFTSPDHPQDEIRWGAYRLDILRRLVGERRQYQTALAALNSLMGQPAAMSLSLDTGAYTTGTFLEQFGELRPVFISSRFGPKAEQFVQAEAVKNNPLMKIKSSAVAVQGARLDFSRSRAYPGIGLRGWFGYVDSLADRAGFEEKHNVWSITTSLSWSLFLGGSGAKSRQLAKTAVDRAEYEKDAARLQVVAAVQTGWNRLAALGMEMPLAAASATQSGIYLDSVKQEYLAGRRSISDALDAVKTDFDARLDQLSTRFVFFQSLAGLVHDIGWSTYDQPERDGIFVVRRIQEYLRSTLPTKP